MKLIRSFFFLPLCRASSIQCNISTEHFVACEWESTQNVVQHVNRFLEAQFSLCLFQHLTVHGTVNGPFHLFSFLHHYCSLRLEFFSALFVNLQHLIMLNKLLSINNLIRLDIFHPNEHSRWHVAVNIMNQRNKTNNKVHCIRKNSCRLKISIQVQFISSKSNKQNSNKYIFCETTKSICAPQEFLIWVTRLVCKHAGSGELSFSQPFHGQKFWLRTCFRLISSALSYSHTFVAVIALENENYDRILFHFCHRFEILYTAMKYCCWNA